MSVEGDVKKKLDRDFDKRTTNPQLPAGVDSKRVTYVAVTARSFDKKKAWVKEKKAQGRWADVRVYDVDDLATWVEQAPAVATWFGASELGRSTSGIRTVEEFLFDFSNAFTPPLPASIVLSGEERAKQSRELLMGLVGMDEYLVNLPVDHKASLRLWKISAESANEALLFILATLSSTAKEAASLRERTLIVENQEAFRACMRMQSLGPLLLLPTIPSAVPPKFVGHRVQAALPVTWDEKIERGEGARLDLIPHYPLEKALEEAGYEDPRRLARESDGRLSKLRVLLMGAAYGRRASTVSAEHIALLLAGAWNPTHEADREVLRRLGADPDKADRLCGLLSQGDDPLLESDNDDRVGTGFRLVFPRVAWKKLGRDVTQSDLKRFFQVVQDALARNPVQNEEEARANLQSPIERDFGRLSSAAYEGLAASIAWLAIADEEGDLEPTHRRSVGAGWAGALVRNLLEPDGRHWKWYSGILRQLAEAAPEQFLENLFDTLKNHPEAIDARSPELLWALETLAWCEDLLSRVVLLLAALDVLDDRQEKGSNSAFRSLGEILHYGLPQSKTTAEQRIGLFRQLFDRHQEVAWRLAVSQLKEFGGMGGFLIPTPRPQYRRWVAQDEKPAATYGDVREQAEALIEMVIERAGIDPARWAELVTLPHHTLGWRILDALKEAYPRIVDADAVLWDAVRKDLSHVAWANALNEKRKEESKPVRTEEQSRLLELYQSKIPTDLVLRFRWLFEYSDRLPERVAGGDDANNKKRDGLIKQAIVELGHESDRWVLFERLATQVKEPRRLAEALAQCAYVDDVEQALLEDPPLLDLGPALDWFWAHRKQSKADKWPDFLRDLVAKGRVNDVTRILLRFQGSEETWNIVDALGEPLRTNYWSKHEPLWFDRISQAAYERGISCLLDAGRVEAAVEACGTAIHYDLIVPSTILRVLHALRDTDKSQGLESYEVEQLFSELDKHAEVSEDELIELEIALAERFDFAHAGYETRGAKRFYAKLNQSPEYFVEVVRRMQKPGAIDIMDELFEEPKDTAAIERKNLRSLMYDWRGYPGVELPVAQRETTLERWCNDVFRLAGNLEKQAAHYLETMLARVDPAEDGHWPCLAARKLIEIGKIMPGGFSSAASYQPGLQPVDVGERNMPLRELAEQYERSAKALATTYPATAAMLREMAADRRREAESVEARERREHIEWGERGRDPEEAAEPEETNSVTSTRVTVDDSTPKSPATLIQVQNAAPAPEFSLELAPRLNMLTGDNSLGKTFVLDVLWWALTGSWAGHPAKPEPKHTKNGKIAKSKAAISAKTKHREITGTFNALHERWSMSPNNPIAPGLVIYARVDGGFSVWDPIRNIAPIAKDEVDLSKGYHFTPHEVWNGKELPDGTQICRGLIDDIAIWRKDPNSRDTMDLLDKVLKKISPSAEEPIEIVEAARFTVRGTRDIPRLKLPYGLVFVEHASASVKRMLSLAYMLVWAITELRRAAPVAEMDPLRHVTFLVDEIEAHLHPKWQRTILRALLGLSNDIAPKAEVQWLVTTHAPLVLVSIEQLVSDDHDALFDFNLDEEKNVAMVKREPWEIHGDVNAWLSSEIFDHVNVRSEEAEGAIKEMSDLLTMQDVEKERGRRAYENLVKVLGPQSAQLLRFRFLAEKKGWLS